MAKYFVCNRKLWIHTVSYFPKTIFIFYNTVLYLYSMICICPYVRRFWRFEVKLRSGHIFKKMIEKYEQDMQNK
ncbi:MAG: hypothetical protein EGR16_05730 [Clostridiales bacterium]|nr:hypothetical protein [Clostridiales bacterium]